MRFPFHHLTLLILLSPLTSTAQVAVGPQAGTVFSWMEFYDDGDAVQDHIPTTNSRIGFGFGVLVDIPVGTKFHLQPELAFRQKGYEETPRMPFGFSDEEFMWRYDHLDLGLFVRFHPGGTRDGFMLLAGPSVNRLLGMRVRDANVTPFEPDYPLNWQTGPVQALDPGWLGFALMDVAMNVGIGNLFESGGTRLMLELRYQHGLANVHQGFMVRDINAAPIGEMNSRNRAVILNVGWLLPVKSAE